MLTKRLALELQGRKAPAATIAPAMASATVFLRLGFDRNQLVDWLELCSLGFLHGLSNSTRLIPSMFPRRNGSHLQEPGASSYAVGAGCLLGNGRAANIASQQCCMSGRSMPPSGYVKIPVETSRLPALSIARVSSSGTHTQPAAFNEAIITSAEWPCEMPRWMISVGLNPGCLLGSGGSGRDLGLCISTVEFFP
jgi:hypothetical protein